MSVLHWLGHWTGVSDEGGAGYAFWSGIGGDLGILAGVAVYVRHKNCHTRGCWRIGRHLLDGTPYRLCSHHHPAVPAGGPTADHFTEGA